MSEATTLSEIKAQRAALAEAKAKRDAARDAAEAPELEARLLREELALDKAEIEIGPLGRALAVVQTDLGAIILKRPAAVIFKRFQDSASMRSEELEKLVRPCLVYPVASDFVTIIDALPATLIRCANAVSVLAGVRTEELQGKS